MVIVPEWEIHRKWARRLLGTGQEKWEWIIDDVNELIDFPEKQGWFVEHDWTGVLFNEDVLRQELTRRHGRIGPLLADLHLGLDAIDARTDPKKRSHWKSFAKATQMAEGTRGTTINPVTGRPVPKFSLEVGDIIRGTTPGSEYPEPEELINEIKDVLGDRGVDPIIQRFLADNLIEILEDVRPRLLEREEWIEFTRS